jgi:hypothetical protein
MADTIFNGPPQSAHLCRSKPKTRASSSAQRVARLGSGGVIVAASAAPPAGAGSAVGRGTISERIRACGAKATL